MCYYMYFEEFVDNYGYGTWETERVLEIWNSIKDNNSMLLELMSEDDIEFLRDNIRL